MDYLATVTKAYWIWSEAEVVLGTASNVARR